MQSPVDYLTGVSKREALHRAAHCRRCLIRFMVEGTQTSTQPDVVARPAGLEPATYGLEGRCSIRLSYKRLHQGVPSYGSRRFERQGHSLMYWWAGRDLNPWPRDYESPALTD